MDPKIDQYKKALSQKDAILEENIYADVLSKYIKEGGDDAPLDAIGLLSKSYVGLPSMCNITAESAGTVGVDSQSILRDAVKSILTERFDPKQCDEFFMSSEESRTTKWFDMIVDDAHWRQTVYELLEKHPNCQFLSSVVKRIADTGNFDNEISQLKTATSSIKVFNLILRKAITDLVKKDDLEFEESMPSLARVCCSTEETYIYAQTLLRRIRVDHQGGPFIRLSKELEEMATINGENSSVNTLRAYLSEAPPQLVNAINATLKDQHATPGDIITLYRLYTSSNPPSVDHIRDFTFIRILLSAVFVPSSGQNLKPEISDKVLYLVAYASATNDSTKDPQDTESVYETLKDLHAALKDKDKGGSLQGAMKDILSAVRLPVASIAILYWIQYMSLYTQYYDDNFRTAEAPELHLVLDEIAERHPLQQPLVFEVIQKCLKHQYHTLPPEFMVKLQEMWVDRLLYLVQLDFVIPVLRFLQQASGDLDDSLIEHFIEKLLKMAKAPYTAEFVEHVADVISTVKIHMMKGVHASVFHFFDQAMKGQEPLSDELQQKITSIMQACSVKRKRERSE